MAAEESARLGVLGGGRYVADLQRGRLLSATFALVGETGYEGVSARSVAGRAGVSNRAFYECFSDREDCFLAAFNHAVDGLELELRRGWESERGWTARVRAALASLLRALDREPVVGRLVLVEALGAGPRVLARRARALEELAEVVDRGRENAAGSVRVAGLGGGGCGRCDVWCDSCALAGASSGVADRPVGRVDGDDRAAVPWQRGSGEGASAARLGCR